MRLVLPELERFRHQGYDDHPAAHPDETAEQTGDQTDQKTCHINPQSGCLFTPPRQRSLSHFYRPETKTLFSHRAVRGLTTAQSYCPLSVLANILLYNF